MFCLQGPLLTLASSTFAPQPPTLCAALSANETSEAESLVQDILDAALNVSRVGQFPIVAWLAQWLG